MRANVQLGNKHAQRCLHFNSLSLSTANFLMYDIAPNIFYCSN